MFCIRLASKVFDHYLLAYLTREGVSPVCNKEKTGPPIGTVELPCSSNAHSISWMVTVFAGHFRFFAGDNINIISQPEAANGSLGKQDNINIIADGSRLFAGWRRARPGDPPAWPGRAWSRPWPITDMTVRDQGRGVWVGSTGRGTQVRYA
jgi:hypothetical protein